MILLMIIWQDLVEGLIATVIFNYATANPQQACSMNKKTCAVADNEI